MRKETERISSIIRDLLDFARPATPHSLQGEPGNIEAAVHETVALVAHQPALRDVDLAIDVHLDLPRVRLSHSQLTQVLLNLILNAAYACKDGGQIAIGAEPGADSMLQLTVHDDGPGVPKELQDRIFEPFVSSKDVGEGSGLGLSVCRGLVEAVGGRIWLDTEAKSGARFVVLLPSSDRVSVG